MNTQIASTTFKSISTGADAPPRPRPGSGGFPAMLEAYKSEIARALPKHLTPDAMSRIALTCFRMNPKLGDCLPSSVFACVIQASQLGLRPGLLGEAYLIPYKDQCTLQIGYQGLLELVRRSGLVEGIAAHLVHAADSFDVQFGTDPGIVHRPFLDGDPGPVRLVYAVARLKGGGTHVELMTLDEIQRIRNRSQNVQNAARYDKKTPWDTDFGEMARKTVLRRICKYLPKSPDLASALALDDSGARGAQQLTVQDAIGNSFVPPAYIEHDEPTGEVDPPAPPAPEPETEAKPPVVRRGPGRPRNAPPVAGNGAPATPTPATPREPAQDDGPRRRTYDELAGEIRAALGPESAALVLDEARDMLDAEELDDLAGVYTRTWGQS